MSTYTIQPHNGYALAQALTEMLDGTQPYSTEDARYLVKDLAAVFGLKTEVVNPERITQRDPQLGGTERREVNCTCKLPNGRILATLLHLHRDSSSRLKLINRFKNKFSSCQLHDYPSPVGCGGCGDSQPTGKAQPRKENR